MDIDKMIEDMLNEREPKMTREDLVSVVNMIKDELDHLLYYYDEYLISKNDINVERIEGMLDAIFKTVKRLKR
jgi:tRNA G26 N,N-dimethylase Trm1